MRTRLLYTGDFDTLKKLGFEKDDSFINYKKDSLYIGVFSKIIFIPMDIVGDSLCVLYDLIQLNLVKKEVE